MVHLSRTGYSFVWLVFTDFVVPDAWGLSLFSWQFSQILNVQSFGGSFVQNCSV